MFKLINGVLIAACVAVWTPALMRPAVKYEDSVCPSKPVFVRYPDGMRQAYCKPTGIVWANLNGGR